MSRTFWLVFWFVLMLATELVRSSRVLSGRQRVLLQMASVGYVGIFLALVYAQLPVWVFLIMVILSFIFHHILPRLSLGFGNWTKAVAFIISLPFIPVWIAVVNLMRLFKGEDWETWYFPYSVLPPSQIGRRMMEGFERIREKKVREIMVPRIDMVCIDEKARVSEALELMSRSGHSRLPVFKENIDKIVGFVYIKDLLPALLSGKGREKIKSYLRQVHFVPEGKSVEELLWEFQDGHFQLAIVLDEYGGTAGLVTLEDILEELVGEIVDEYEKIEDLIKEIEPGVYVVQGLTPVEEVERKLKLKFPEGDFDTVAGFLYSQLGYIPRSGEVVEVNGVKFVITKVVGNRIKKIRIELHPSEES